VANILKRPFNKVSESSTPNHLTQEVVEVLTAAGKPVAEVEVKAFEKISEVLLNRRKMTNIIGIDVATGFGKTLILRKFAELIAKTRSDAVTIVLPYVESVTEFHDACELISPGGSIAIRSREMCGNDVAYQSQFDEAATVPVVIMTSAMLRHLLDSKTYDVLQRFRGVAPEREIIRQVLIDENIELLRVHKITETQINEVLVKLRSAIFHERNQRKSTYAVKTLEVFEGKVQRLLAQLDAIERKLFVVERVGPIDESYTLAQNLVDTVNRRHDESVKAALHSIEFVLRNGCRVEFSSRRSSETNDFEVDRRNDHVFEHTLTSHESLVDSLIGFPVTFFDATCTVDYSYNLLPGIEFIKLPPVFDFSNVTLTVCNSNTASRSWSTKPDSIQKLKLLINGELSDKYDRILLTSYKGLPTELLSQAIGENEKVMFMNNASGRGSNAYEGYSALIHNGTAIPSVGVQVSNGDEHYADVDGAYTLSRVGIEYEDIRLQALVENDIGVRASQLIGRMRSGRRTDAVSIYSLNLPPGAVDVIKATYPGITVRYEPFLSGSITDRITEMERMLSECPDEIVKKKTIANRLGIDSTSLAKILRTNPSAKRVIAAAGYEVLNGQSFKKKKLK